MDEKYLFSHSFPPFHRISIVFMDFFSTRVHLPRMTARSKRTAPTRAILLAKCKKAQLLLPKQEGKIGNTRIIGGPNLSFLASLAFSSNHVPVRFSCGRPPLARNRCLDFTWLIVWEPEDALVVNDPTFQGHLPATFTPRGEIGSQMGRTTHAFWSGTLVDL